MRILIVEDSRPVAEATRLVLAKRGWSSDIAESAETASTALGSGAYDLVLLDLMLPDADGFSILQQIRSSGSDVPVIVLTGLSDSRDVCKALRLGADEFLKKPIDAAEMNLRIDAVMRRCERNLRNRLRVGQLELFLDENTARIADAPLKLTKREFQVLAILAKRKGAAVSKETLCAAIYDNLPSTRSHLDVIQVFIHKLRRKLETSGVNGIRILHSWGEGYTLHVA